MTISKDHITVSTVKSAIAIVLFVSTILAVFYNAQADTAKTISDVSERVAKVETNIGNTEQRLDRIEGKLDGILNSLRQNPSY